MKKKLIMLILISTLIFSNIQIVSSLPPPVGIAGYLYDGDGNVIPGVTVTVLNNDTGDTDTDTTDATGLYVCSLMGSDTDLLIISASHGNASGTNNTYVDTDLLTQWLNLTLESGNLMASFSYLPHIPKPNQNIKFTDLSIGPPDTWHWNFGDGTIRVGKNQNHMYENEGDYTVTLEVWKGTDVDRCQKTVKVRSITTKPSIPDTKEPKYPEGYTVEECYSILNADKLKNSNNNIKIVVMDSGVYPTTYDGVSLENVIKKHDPYYQNGYDYYGHGTAVSYEVEWLLQNKLTNYEHISYRAFDDEGTSTSQVFLNSLDEIKKLNPDVVSISAGAMGSKDDAFSHKIKELHDMGIIVVCAGGNYGPDKYTIISPACSADAIAVGATDPERTVSYIDDDTVCSWSSRGPVPSLGEDKPDIVAPGESIRLPWRNMVKVRSGTSLSTPLIAGGTAVVISEHKGLIGFVKTLWFWNKGVVPDAYEDALEQSAVRGNDADSWGAGLVQFDKVSEHFYWSLVWLAIFPILVIIAITSITLIIYLKRKQIMDMLGLEYT